MRKKVSLIVMVLTILLMAHLTLNANAQPGSTPPVPTQGIETGTTNTQIQGSQAEINEIEKQLQDLMKEITQLADEEKELQQELKEEQSGAPGTDTQQQSQGFRKQGGQQAKLQQLQQIQVQLEQKQQERKQLKLKLQQVKQRQEPPHKSGH